MTALSAHTVHVVPGEDKLTKAVGQFVGDRQSGQNIIQQTDTLCCEHAR